jgi:hypothetical protein
MGRLKVHPENKISNQRWSFTLQKFKDFYNYRVSQIYGDIFRLKRNQQCSAAAGGCINLEKSPPIISHAPFSRVQAIGNSCSNSTNYSKYP